MRWDGRGPHLRELVLRGDGLDLGLQRGDALLARRVQRLQARLRGVLSGRCVGEFLVVDAGGR